MAMNIQLIGYKKNSDCRKGERFLKERGIDFHFRDLSQKELSRGEWEKLFQQHHSDQLMDKTSASFKKKNFSYKVFDSREELIEDNSLLVLPILRIDNKFYIGFEEKQWKTLF